MASVSGGDRMKREMAKVVARLKSAHVVRAGFTEQAKYPDGTAVALVASAQNFGAPAQGIPPRPFFSNTIAAKRKIWGADLGTLLKKTKLNAREALELMGARMAGDIKQGIVDKIIGTGK